ncbi:hypothetical protein [Fibrobacter sp. UWP2]|uniref:hypothetical protein n=1 Tax=Fibrobacter sp. UWP2 TaxID=1896216 RepID=UPI0009249924|nr:hypothetical protein [Fibrobacter sp. UWP2]SHJ28784.1 hypothetical protein SAMN05720471_12525 [Fibrobacter sp. UWP2]
MKFFEKSLTLAALSLMVPVASFAYFDHGNAGLEIFSFMGTFDSPRNAALEKSAGASPSTDPTITQLNPAAIRMEDGKKRVIEAHWQTGEFADNQGSIYYTSTFRKFIYQISYNWLDYGSITGYDELGFETGIDYQPFSQLATASLAFPMKHIQFGFTAKVASDRLAEEEGDRTAFGAAFDWGVSWQASSKLFGFSFMARDFGCLLRDYVDDGDDEFYPMSQTFALAGFFRPQSVRRLTLYAESDFPRYAEANLNLGAEYALGSYLSIRLGFTRTWLDLVRDFKELASSESRPSESNEAHMVSGGLGFSNSLFAVDYSFSYLAQGLGFEHRVGLRVGF